MTTTNKDNIQKRIRIPDFLLYNRYKGKIMKYTKGGTFTTQEMSMLETLQELEDVVQIAKTICLGENDAAYKNLDGAELYISHLRKKIKIALEHVPKNIQEQEFL